MLNTVNTGFSFIEIWFTDQNSKPLEIDDNGNITLMIGSIEDRKNTETKYSIKPRDRKYIDRFLLKGFLLFGKSAAKKFGD